MKKHDNKKLAKCEVYGTHVKPCQNLQDACHPENPTGNKKGVFCWKLYNRDMGATRTFFGAKSGNFTKQGIAFNFCPFCGEQIDAPFATC